MIAVANRTPSRRHMALGIGGLAGLMLLSRRRDDLRGNVALITGGSRGLGLELARELGKQGCTLAICARDQQELDRAAGELRSEGYDVLAETCDVSDNESVQAFVGRVEGRFGRIDLLVANAGEIQVGPVEALSVADFERMMNIDFYGALHPIMAALPGMRERRAGRIVLIASVAGRIAIPHQLAYSTAKFALVGLGEGLSVELARDGIAVTTVLPGILRTGMHVQASFAGSEAQREADFAWFATGSSAPTSPPANKAARTIVDAIRLGKREVTFPWSVMLVSKLHGVAPVTTDRVLQAADKRMPHHPTAPGEIPATERGEPIQERNESQVLHALTTLGRRAEADFNQA